MSPSPAARGWMAAARRELLEQGGDAARLYTRWFHQETQSTWSWPTPAAFSAATLDARGLEPGWRVIREAPVMAGAVLALRGGHTRLLAPPEMAPADVAGLMPGRSTALLAQPLTSAESGGFWHLWSAGWQRASPRRMQRVYITVRCEQALELARCMAMWAPPRSVWAVKLLCGAHEAGRRDRAVLYLPRELALSTPWVRAILRRAEPLCSDDLPPFVERLAPGIGHASDPGGGRSYGQAVCEAMASAAACANDAQAFEDAAWAAVQALPAQTVDAEFAQQNTAEIPLPAPSMPTRSEPPQDWRTAALRVAQEIAADAVWADGLCTFHGATSPETLGSPPRFRSMGGDVYEGTAGIARFLGRTAAMAGDADLAAAAKGAMLHALGHVDAWALFTGGLGAGLVGLELAALLDEPELLAPSVAAIDDASASAVAAGAPHDFLVGTAGVIVGLVAACRYDRSGSWGDRARMLGHGLLATAVADGPEGADGPPLSWRLGGGVDARLCGLAHGAAGIAMALEALARITPEDRAWRRAARQARAYERAHYSRQFGSWADLRPQARSSAQPGYPHMWCHGSIGIGAERLAVMGDDLLARADATGALAGAKAHAMRLLQGPVGPGAGDEVNASVCHGIAGLVDLFIDAWLVSGDSAWMALAGELGVLMRNDARRTGGWRSGVPGGWPAPGLMLGKAGAGWAMLRLSAPEQVPSAWQLGPAALMM